MADEKTAEELAAEGIKLTRAFVYAVKFNAPWAPEPMYAHPMYFTEEAAREHAELAVQPGWTYEIEGFSVRDQSARAKGDRQGVAVA